MSSYKKIFILIFLIVIFIAGYYIIFINKNLNEHNSPSSPSVEDDSDLDSPSGTKDDNDYDITTKANIFTYNLEIEPNSEVDLNSFLDQVNLSHKTPIYGQTSESYDTAIIITSDQHLGPIYLVDCAYDPNSGKFTYSDKNKIKVADNVTSNDALIYLCETPEGIPYKSLEIKTNTGEVCYYALSYNGSGNLEPQKIDY